MLPVTTGGHSAYQNFVGTNLRKCYPNPDALARSTWDIIERFWPLDLSYTDERLRCKYSIYGPKPRTPSCMHRSYLLSLDFKVTSLTDWATQLIINPLYAILSGFEVSNTPGVGTFYDFMNRLWDFSISDQPYACLFDIYKNEFLNISVSKGLINPKSLSLAGDGTPVVTSARERRHRVCACASKGINDCHCNRYFSQPDCDIGWDSSRACFNHGYDLYMLVASDSESDLPIIPLLSPASRHDSHGFLHTFFRMKYFLPEFNVT